MTDKKKAGGIQPSFVRAEGPILSPNKGSSIGRFLRWLFRRPKDKRYMALWIVGARVIIEAGSPKEGFQMAKDEATDAIKERVVSASFQEIKKGVVGALKVGKVYYPVYWTMDTGLDTKAVFIGPDALLDLLDNPNYVDSAAAKDKRKWKRIAKKLGIDD